MRDRNEALELPSKILDWLVEQEDIAEGCGERKRIVVWGTVMLGVFADDAASPGIKASSGSVSRSATFRR